MRQQLIFASLVVLTICAPGIARSEEISAQFLGSVFDGIAVDAQDARIAIAVEQGRFDDGSLVQRGLTFGSSSDELRLAQGAFLGGVGNSGGSLDGGRGFNDVFGAPLRGGIALRSFERGIRSDSLAQRLGRARGHIAQDARNRRRAGLPAGQVSGLRLFR
jgi:hypothetical protein